MASEGERLSVSPIAPHALTTRPVINVPQVSLKSLIIHAESAQITVKLVQKEL